MPKLQPERNQIHFDSFTLDVRAGELLKSGARVPVQEQPLRVLAVLLEHPGDVVTRDELHHRLWPDDTFVDFDHGLNKAINKLRDALDDSAQKPRFVETLPKRGYRFIGAVADPPEATPAVTRQRWLAVAALVAVLGGALIAFRSGGAPARESGRFDERATLVVLPFENLSSDVEQEYFSDGLTEEMISQLAALSPDRLGVIARTSSMHYKNTRKRLDEIAGELGVSYVLEGTVRRAGDRLRITAQLVQTSDQTHLWTESYDRRLEDVFAIQEDVAKRIADSLTLELLPRGPKRPSTADPKAYEAYLRGRFYWNTRTQAGLRRGLSFFEQAVAEDDAYAQAHVGIADSYILLANYGAEAPEQALPRAIEAAERALQLDPALADADVSRTWARWIYDLHWDEAAESFPRAMRSGPTHPFSYQLYANYLAALGRHADAMAEMKRAQELDPLSLVISAVLAWHHLLAREPELAIEQSVRTLEMDETFSRAHSYLGWGYLQTSRPDEAIRELERSLELVGSSAAREAELAHAYAVAGRHGDARRLLDELAVTTRERYVPADLIAKVHLALGDRDTALEWLERAIHDRSLQRATFAVDPLLEPLHEDLEFVEMLERLHYPTPAELQNRISSPTR